MVQWVSNIANLKEEYQQATENLRHFGNLRFAQLTLFSALTGGLAAAIFGENSSLLPFAQSVVKGAGIWIALMFLLMDIRVTGYLYFCGKRIAEIETALGYRQFTLQDPLFIEKESANVLLYFFVERALTSSVAAWLIYAGTVVFWLLTFVWPHEF